MLFKLSLADSSVENELKDQMRAMAKEYVNKVKQDVKDYFNNIKDQILNFFKSIGNFFVGAWRKVTGKKPDE